MLVAAYGVAQDDGARVLRIMLWERALSAARGCGAQSMPCHDSAHAVARHARIERRADARRR